MGCYTVYYVVCGIVGVLKFVEKLEVENNEWNMESLKGELDLWKFLERILHEKFQTIIWLGIFGHICENSEAVA